ncbi:putative iron compound ABC transporter permease [Escherichia coli]|uniref:Putative iron compound ABC transporter permease n=1 Tax=Escherichia coli TaxID=562 RepID=A0A484Y7I1_ECOLX|nr:putative iron compound ABC transporter permease [Escherichia coli]
MQGLFRNPMADPGLLGVSSGSALMVGVAIVLPFSFPVVLVLYGANGVCHCRKFSGLHHHFSHHASAIAMAA